MGGDNHGYLETGHDERTPAGDNLVLDLMRDHARSFAVMAEATGRRVLADDELGVVMVDNESPVLYLNSVAVLRPMTEADAEVFVKRARAFFGERPGGPFTVWSMWPTPDLKAHGLHLGGHPPLMVRAPGGETPAVPDGLDIVRVDTPERLHDYEQALAVGFGLVDAGHAESVHVFDVDAAFASGWHHFVGYVDGTPVASAAAFAGDHVTRVDNVATRAEFRGRGYGEALTWQATLVHPDRPAALLASDLGRPVYARMGYMTVLRAVSWVGSR
jgi:ribosomal protein S18 acetylase RimI-like enzyme